MAVIDKMFWVFEIFMDIHGYPGNWIFMNIHEYPRKNDMDMDMDMNRIFLIHGKPVMNIHMLHFKGCIMSL